MLANGWADIYVQRANEIFGQQNGEQVDFFRAQLNTATVELEQAQQAMIAFQGQNRSVILDGQLRNHIDQQSAFLARQRRLGLILQDIAGLERQLAARSANQPATTADQLTALLLQLKAFEADQGTGLQFQLDSLASSETLSVSEQQALISTLTAVLLEMIEEINIELAALEPQVLRIQADLQQLEATRDRLARDLTIAQETYTTFSRKLEEARLTTEGVGSEVQLASYAAVPDKASRMYLFIYSIAGTVLAIIASASVIAWYTWKNIILSNGIR
jgi:uncharacterized protein involved in exopolysaccharide biosynthesis